MYSLDEIIGWLEVQFPDRLPDKEVSSYELGRLRGELDIIEILNGIANGSVEISNRKNNKQH
jgi:hypothetical protein